MTCIESGIRRPRRLGRLTSPASIVALVIGTGLLTPLPHASALTPTEVADFMIQDVCVDVAGNALAADPYACPDGTTRRNLREGETLPYHKHDQPQTGAPDGFQISDSFPRSNAAGGVRFVHTLDDATLGAFREHHPDYDGYNVDEGDGSWSSIIGTKDHTGTQFMYGPGCVLADSWLVFNNGVTLGTGSSGVASLGRVYSPSECPSSYVSAYTTWNYYADPLTYTSGKSLGSIVSNHYNTGDVSSATAIEVFYYTREYGLTRWEAWNKTGPANAPPCNGGVTSGPWYRVDCRDWTQIRMDPNGGYNPRVWPTHGKFAEGNRLGNADLGAGTSSVAPWQRISSTTTNWAVVQETNGNHHLAINCIDMCNGNAVYQDVPRSTIPTGATMTWGGTYWASANGSAGNVVVFQLRSDGSISTSHTIQVSSGTTRQKVEATFSVAADAAYFRYTYYPLTSGVNHMFDDTWLARVM